MIINHHRYCLQQLHELIDLDVKGDVLECGIGRGNNSLQMGAWLQDLQADKKIWACDTFEGLPYTDEESSHITSDLKKGECIHRKYKEFQFERNKQNLRKYVMPVKGLIEETLPGRLSDRVFCFVWLDVDLYKPTLFAWEWLQDKMTAGSIIGIHDYKYWRCPGIDDMVDNIIRKNENWFEWYNKGTSIFFKRVT